MFLFWANLPRYLPYVKEGFALLCQPLFLLSFTFSGSFHPGLFLFMVTSRVMASIGRAARNGQIGVPPRWNRQRKMRECAAAKHRLKTMAFFLLTRNLDAHPLRRLAFLALPLSFNLDQRVPAFYDRFDTFDRLVFLLDSATIFSAAFLSSFVDPCRRFSFVFCLSCLPNLKWLVE